MASWFSSLYDWLEPPSAPDAASIEARLNGYDWEDINGHLDGQYQEALDNGYSKDEIDQHLGKPTDEDTQQRLSREAAARASYDDKFVTGLSAPKQSIPLTPLEDLPSKRIGDYAGKPAPEVTPPTDFIEPPPVGGLFDDGSVRSSYARGLLLGDDRTPGDFAERYAGAAWGAAGDDADGATVVRAASELAKTLPSNQDFIDQAIAIAHSQGIATTPEGVQTVKNNLVAEWADEGEPLQSIYARAQTDPDFAASLVTPPKVDAPWWSPLTVDPEAEVYQETIWPAIQQGLSDWWGWRVQQFQEDEKNRLTWDQLKSGDYTPDQLLNDPAVGVGLGFAGSIINSVGSKLADTLFPKIVEAIKGKPEPQIPVFDPATGIVNPRPVSEQFAAPKPAERAPVEEGALPEPLDILGMQQRGELSAEKAAQTAEELKTRAKGIEDEVFGENADQWRTLQRRSNSAWNRADDAKAREYDAQIAEIESKVSQADLDRVFGIGEKGPSAEDWSDIAKQLRDVEASREDAVQVIAGEVRNLPELGRQPTDTERGSIAVIAHALDTEAKRGGDPMELLREGLQERIARYGGGADAEELIRDQMTRLRALMEAPPTLKEVPALPKPQEFVPEATPAEKMQALARTWIEDKAGLLEDMRLQNLGITPDEFGPNFFQNLAAKQDPATQELAKGWDAARGMWNYLADLGGRLMRDESGALNIFRTPEQQARAGAKVASRNFMQELVIRQRSLGERQQASILHGMDYTKTVAGEVENSFALVAPYMKEWERELAKGPAGNPMGTYIGNLIEYMQGRSLGFALKHDSRLAPVADQIRSANQYVEGLMRDAEARGLHNMNSYYEDYFRHQWKDPNKADIVFGTGRQGSSSALQQRKYLTYADGIAAGLEPIEPNPVHATLLGTSQTIKYLKTLEMIDEGTKNPNGFMYYALSPRDKWDVPLDGVGSRKLFVDANGKPGEMRLYANEGAARVWNNWLSLNFYKNPVVKEGLAQKWYYIKNTFTGLNLVGPMFHAISTTWEALAGGMGVALQEMAVGAARADIREFGRGVLDLTKTATVAPKIIEHFRRGDRGFDVYRTMAQDPILDLVLESGARIGPRQEIYKMGSAPNIVTSIMRKSFGEEYRQLGRYIIGDPKEPLEYRLFHGVTDRAVGALGHEVGRILTNHSAPLFDYAIPRLKLGTNLEQTEMLVRQNLTQPRDWLLQRTRQITRNTDDRLGELNMDNIFWPRWVKATAQATMLSVGWVYGTLSMTARALSSAGYLATGGRAFTWDPAAFRNMLGYATVWVGANSIYQYLKTGQMPWNTDTSLKDILAGRPGGSTPEGAVERSLLPGQAKEYFDWGKIIATMIYDPMKTPEALFNYAAGKGHNLIQLMRGLVTGHDAIGHDIKNMAGGWTGFFEKQLLPIFIQNFGERKKGTGISQWESLIGVRNAPQFFENPDRFYHGLEVADQISARNEYRRAVRENARLETPRELPEPPTGAGGRGGGGGRGAGRYEDPYLHWNSRSGQGGRGRGYSLEPGGGGGRDIEPGGLSRIYGRGSGGPFARGRGRGTRGQRSSGGPAYQDWAGRRGGGRMLTVEQ